METKEYKLLDGRTIRAKYDRLRMTNINISLALLTSRLYGTALNNKEEEKNDIN